MVLFFHMLLFIVSKSNQAATHVETKHKRQFVLKTKEERTCCTSMKLTFLHPFLVMSNYYLWSHFQCFIQFMFLLWRTSDGTQRDAWFVLRLRCLILLAAGLRMIY